MGAYLSSPVTDKISFDESCSTFTYGASSMQGWRINQEDAHNCIPDFDQESGTSLFAVYDGHGGSEVAHYCSKYLPDCIKDSEQYREGELGPAMIDAFLKFDSTLVQEDVIKELKLLAGVDENDEEEDDEDPVNRAEADDLRAEADLPLDELLAKYKTSPAGGAAVRHLRKKENLQSPVVPPKNSSNAATSDSDARPSSSSDIAGHGACSNSAGSSASSSLANGVADNENNQNTERELLESEKSEGTQLQDSAMSSSSSVKDGGDDDGEKSSRNSQEERVPSSSNHSGGGDSGGEGVVGSSKGCGGEGEGCDRDKEEGGGSSSDASPSKSVPFSDEVSSTSSPIEAIIDDDHPSPSSGVGSSRGSRGNAAGSSKAGKSGPLDVEMGDDSDDDDNEDEDEWQDLESGDDDDDDDDDDGDVEDGDEPMMDMSNEEPGSDSGCTACVVLLRDDLLVVANAGDSRCVLCRGGCAIDMSLDHKPEDDNERQRIENAGGRVTADGRVNGGLNLSRAIGDHFYKRKEDLPSEQQMITALPDIQTAAVDPMDQFFVVACDGIWNSMSSQECVDFVAERLKDPAKKAKPSIICEELFDHCLAENTYGDGTGCDNMTCVIVVLHPKGRDQGQGQKEENGAAQSSKRCVQELDTSTEEKNVEKKPRVEDQKEGEGEKGEGEKGEGEGVTGSSGD